MARAKRCGSNAWRRRTTSGGPLVSNEVGRDVCFGKARRLHEDFANDIFADGIDAVSCHCWAIHRRPEAAWLSVLALRSSRMPSPIFFSDKVALYSSGAQPVSREQAPSLVRRDGTARREGEYSGAEAVRLCRKAAPNAFATGRNPRHASVAVTQGLLELMNGRRTGGPMIAHETVARAELRHSHQLRRRQLLRERSRFLHTWDSGSAAVAIRDDRDRALGRYDVSSWSALPRESEERLASCHGR